MKKSTRWTAAAAIPVAVIAAGLVVPAVSATADVPLPSKTPQNVLELVASSGGASFSGTIEQTSDLGLPTIPSSSGGAGTDDVATALELVTGDHTAKVFADGESKQRVQVVEDLAERDVVRNGRSVYAYDSSDKTATHVTLPDDSTVPSPSTLPDGSALPQTPADLAALVLSKVEPSTTVTAADNVKVAGRSAYQIVLTPKDSATLVAAATLTVDAETGVPLKVVVEAKGQDDPAVSAEFTSIDFGTPAADVFEYTPASDVTVTEVTPPSHAQGDDRTTRDGTAAPTVIGSGWSTVVGVTPRAGDSTPDASGSASDTTALLDQLTTKVDGGRVLQTSLVSVFVTDDGRVFAGSVDADALRTAVARATDAQ